MTISTHIIHSDKSMEIRVSVYLGLGFNIRLPIQEDLDRLEVASERSIVECGEPTLAETKLS